MQHLTGLKCGDPVIYDRLGEQLNCKFTELVVVRGKNVASVYHEERGLFLAPPSLVRVSPELAQIL